MSEIKPCPFCGANPHQGLGKVQHCSLRGDPFQRFHIKCPKGHAEISAPNRERAVEGWNARPIEDDLTASLNRTSDACASVQRERDELREMLGRLLNARALSGVRELVAGWNGEHRPDGPYIERHPSRLGARIETNCGRIYELDEIMQEARAFLARYEGGR